ncbi:Relaxase/Mobilisation nuclease domain-containing protein [Dyadobacter soli]|uniref:Relaxase/Mobilisation nuclease domain-containing protein n=1 Tax=Dyadobacter soli TaxID=659014 RepID=A0A1G7MJT9_9BACT|nr:relaxase/mobilization nuclease domain-containing protein [Dyadobacter soli]SDF62002.1 Relaxase/Mobilisation nuclease domain-containing protein [Dyadobacter soli]
MVAVIHSGASLREAVNYNEHKVTRGVAKCIDAGYYTRDADDLNFHQKLSRLQDLIDLNTRIKVNTLHISLNFAAEDRLDTVTLKEVAGVYLEKIGFENQPYLLYEHLDAGHQHVHIVTTNIRPDGSNIKLHNIGKIRSEVARKEIENDYGLVRAEDHKRSVFKLSPVPASIVEYGRAQTKQAISNVLQTVLKEYHFTSVSELNAVLAQYRVLADTGGQGSRIQQRQGLVFRVLGPNGEKLGVPIKASDFYFKPTLGRLQARFEAGAIQRKKHSVRLRNTIDMTLARRSTPSLSAFSTALRQQGVTLVKRASDSGVLYGLTYVDHRTKTVFNGSDLGKPYSAKAVQAAIDSIASQAQIHHTPPLQIRERVSLETDSEPGGRPLGMPEADQDTTRLLSELLQSQRGDPTVPYPVRQPKKKTRRKSL